MPTVADLDTLKAHLGIQTTRDDAVLQADLDAATRVVQQRVMVDSWLTDDVQLAVILSASRLFARRRSPEGVAGFANDGGLVVRIIATDPDIRTLLEWNLDYDKAGIA